jgi:hypothetical protein
MAKGRKVRVAPFALTVEQFRTDYYPASRASVAIWIRTGELASFKDGRRRLILIEGKHGARDFARRKAAGGGAIAPEVSAARAAAGRKGGAARQRQLAERHACAEDA